MSESETVEEEVKTTRRRLTKDFPEEVERIAMEANPVLIINESSTGTEMTFDLSELPENILAKLPACGAGHKLGDAASGKQGQEAVDAIMKTWEGMKEGNWSVRVASQPFNKKEVKARMENLDPEKQEAAQALLAELGYSL